MLASDIKLFVRGATTVTAILGTAIVSTKLIQLGQTAWSLVTYTNLLGERLPNVPVQTFVGFSEISIFGTLLFIGDYLIYRALTTKERKT